MMERIVNIKDLYRYIGYYFCIQGYAVGKVVNILIDAIAPEPSWIIEVEGGYSYTVSRKQFFEMLKEEGCQMDLGNGLNMYYLVNWDNAPKKPDYDSTRPSTD